MYLNINIIMNKLMRGLTGGCAIKQMVLIRSNHTHRAAQMVSRANVWQTGFQLVQTVKSAI